MTFFARARKTWGWVGIVLSAHAFASTPAPEITAPSAQASLSPGERVTVQGAGSELSWLVEYWSTHDLAAGMHALAFGSGSAITFTVPNKADSNTLVRATLTDRWGSVSRDFVVATSRLQ